MKKNIQNVSALSLILTAASACAVNANDSEDLIRQTRLNLRADFDAEADVERVAYIIERVSCAGEAITPLTETVEVDVALGVIPDGTSPLTAVQLSPDSEHHFADLLVLLSEGCYDVTAQPLTETGEVSAICAPATMTNVEVESEDATEVLLVSQCTPEGGSGVLDSITAFNWPPEATAVDFATDKFAARCEETSLCVTFEDPDLDPVEIEWSVVGAPGDAPDIAVSSSTFEDGVLEECITVSGRTAGTYTLNATAYDLMDDEDGSPLRIEDYLAANGSSETSNTSQDIPFHVQAGDSQCECALATITAGPTSTSDSYYGWVDLETGVFSEVARPSGSFRTLALAYDQENERLYALTNAQTRNAVRVVEWDPATGNELQAWNVSSVNSCEAMDFNPADGNLYLSCSTTTSTVFSPRVLQLDPSTGTETFLPGSLSGTGQDDADCLAFLGPDELVGVDGVPNVSRVYFFDVPLPGAGAVSVLGDYAAGTLSGNLGYQEESDTLYGLKNDELVTLDPANGAILTRVPQGIDRSTYPTGLNYSGLAVPNTCPF